MLTTAQLQAIKADILANGDLNAYPNNSDGNFAIAALYGATAVPDFYVWSTNVSIDEIQDAIIYANMTPAQAIPSNLVTNDLLVWQSKSLVCQGKQFNLQNLLLGRSSINASKANIRAAFQDCLTALPSKNDGTNQAAGWTAVQTAMSRKANRLEKLLSTGTGSQASPATMGFEGSVNYLNIEQARNLP